MRLVMTILAGLVVVLALALATAWGSLALWYRLPFAAEWRLASAALFALFCLATLAALFTPRRVPAVIAFGAVFGALLVWWSTIEPEARADWAPEVARQVTGERQGDILTLTDLRDFDWHGPEDFTERWQTRSYDLS